MTISGFRRSSRELRDSTYARIGQIIVGRRGHEKRGRGTRLHEDKGGGGDVRRLTGLRRPRLFVWSATPLRPAHLACSSSLDACVLRYSPPGRRHRRFLPVSNYQRHLFALADSEKA